LWALQSLPSSATGSVVWSTNAGTIANRPIVKPSGGGELYVVKTDGTILLLDPASGSTVWSLPNSASVVRNVWPEFRGTQPTRIYYTTSDGFFHGVLNNFPAPVPLFTPVSPGTGTKFSTMPTVVPSLGKIYLGRDDGRVQQLSQSDGSAECSVVAGIPGTLGDPAQDFSSSNAPDVDRITITTATGSIRRYGIPWSTTGVSVPAPVAEFTLGQNAPNPFATDTRIDYRLPWDARVEVDIFAVDGRRTRRLVREQEPAGAHQAIWDGLDDAGRAVASGPYFYRLRATGSSGRTLESSKKIQVVR
jgi:hypothetical protein